jgi:nicotinamide mononucleotide adenylyltransferase
MFGVCAHGMRVSVLRDTELARDYLQRVYGVRVIEGIISPASDAYGKPGLAAADHRVHMLRLSVANNAWLR